MSYEKHYIVIWAVVQDYKADGNFPCDSKGWNLICYNSRVDRMGKNLAWSEQMSIQIILKHNIFDRDLAEILYK